MVVHLARAGWIRWHEVLPASKPTLRGPLAAQLRFEDGSGVAFTEQGTEKRLAMYIVRNLDDVPGIARLGADVLDSAFDVAALRAALTAAGGTVKTALADQSHLAGIGNAYSDELLHAARLSPFASASRLDDDGLIRLHTAIASIMSEAAERASGRPMTELKDDKRSHLRIHARDGQACPVCGDIIKSVHSGNRSMQYCPTCQTRGKILADRRLSRLLK